MPGEHPSDNPEYTGPPQEYQPALGELKTGIEPIGRQRYGYHDEDLLRRNIKSIITRCDALIAACEAKLRQNHTMLIGEGTKLHDAQETEWPSSLRGEDGTAPAKMYVSYDEYKVMRAKPTRGADYLVKGYEENVRGPAGTNALDIILGVEPLRTEALTIEAFLDKYLGEVNDSAEYRTLELLQDWTFNALTITGRFRDLFQAESTYSSKIPNAEMVKLTKEDAAEYQTLFKVKLNVANSEIAQILKDFEKDYTNMSDVYFDRFLGPALQFRLKAGRGLELKQGDDSFLASQALSATTALNISFEGTLADQLRRNTVFSQKMDALFERLVARDNYVGLIRDLETKGKKIRQPFTTDTATQEEIHAFRLEYQSIEDEKATRNSFKSSHLSLDDIDDPSSHPWAISRWGDTFEGEFFFDVDAATPAQTTNVGPDGEALPFDGMRPGGATSHMHRGVDVDGTRQIHGEESILDDSLVTPKINTAESVVVPADLRILRESVAIDNGVPVVSARLGFQATEGETYELQVVPYVLGLPENDCLRGHELDYPSSPCAPWLLTRKYLDSGDDTGATSGNAILAEGGSTSYVVDSSFTLPLDDTFFVAGYEGETAGDFFIALCERTELSLEWTKKTELQIASNTTLTQKGVCATRLNDTDFLVGCTNNDIPSVILVRANTSGLTMSVVNAAPLIDTNETAILTHWGVTSIDSYNSGANFVVGYAFDEYINATPADEYSSYAYFNLGVINIPVGNTKRDAISIVPSSAQRLSSGLSDSPNVYVKAVSDSTGIVAWDETSTVGGAYTRGYWAKGFGMNGVTLAGTSPEPHLISDYTSGPVVLEGIEGNNALALFSEVAISWPDPEFSDVPTSNMFYDDIAWLKAQGITVGYLNGTYQPSAPLTRGAAALFLYRLWLMAGENAGPFPATTYTDVLASSVYAAAIGFLEYYDLDRVATGGLFRPNDDITRQEMATMIHRLYLASGGSDPSSIPDPGFTDVTASSVFHQDIWWLAYAGITAGYSDDTYRPTNTLSRQATAAFLHNLWIYMGLEPERTTCVGVANPKVLKVDTFEIDTSTYLLSHKFDESHIVDSSLNTNDPAKWISKWDKDQFLVVWGSSFDYPNNEVDYRGKAAIITYDPVEPDGFIQETWDLPLNLPPNDQYASISPRRMGDSDYFVVSSSGGETKSPTRYNEVDDSLYDTLASSLYYVDWPASIEDTAPDPTEYGVLPVTYQDRMHGSFVVLDDGRVLFVWVERDWLNPITIAGHNYSDDNIAYGFAPDLETFLTEDGSVTKEGNLFDLLTGVSCSVFRNPEDGEVYVIVSCMAQQGAFLGGATGANYDKPWQIIYHWDVPTETLTEYSIVEGPAETGDQLTWTNNNPNSPSSIPDWGTLYYEQFIGVPYISGNTWLLPSVNRLQTTFLGAYARNCRPAIWRSTDAGVTWSLAYNRIGQDTVSEIHNGSPSRTIVEHDNILWWTSDHRNAWDHAEKTILHYSDDGGATWTDVNRHQYANAADIVNAPPLFVAPVDGVDQLHLIYSKPFDSAQRGVIGYFDPYPYDLGVVDPFDPTYYNEIIDTPMNIIAARDVIVTIEQDYIVIIDGGLVFYYQIIDTRFHNGVVCFIVDKCSSDSGPRT